MKLKRATVFLSLSMIAVAGNGSWALAGNYTPLNSGTALETGNIFRVYDKILGLSGQIFELTVKNVGYITACNPSDDPSPYAGGIFANCGGPTGTRGITHLLIEGTDSRTEIGDRGKVTVAITSGGGGTNGFEAPGKPPSGCEKVAFLAQSNPSRYRMLIGGDRNALTTYPNYGYYTIANYSPSVGASTKVYCTLATVP